MRLCKCDKNNFESGTPLLLLVCAAHFAHRGGAALPKIHVTPASNILFGYSLTFLNIAAELFILQLPFCYDPSNKPYYSEDVVFIY